MSRVMKNAFAREPSRRLQGLDPTPLPLVEVAKLIEKKPRVAKQLGFIRRGTSRSPNRMWTVDHPMFPQSEIFDVVRDARVGLRPNVINRASSVVQYAYVYSENQIKKDIKKVCFRPACGVQGACESECCDD